MEAQRVISVSLGKMAQSRVQRTGCSLHKSLMVASILQKARHLYVEQAFMMHCRPPPQPAVGPCPPPPLPPAPPTPLIEDDEPTYTDLDACSPAERGVGPAESLNATVTTRRKRLISDEETEEAVASILPKRARTDFVELDACPPVKPDAGEFETDPKLEDEVSELESRVADLSPSKESTKDGGDSDDSDDSCYESGDSDDSESDTMEIDRITSLVSVFSLEKMQRSSAAAVPVSA